MVIENPKGGIAGNSNFLRKLRRGAGGRGGGGLQKSSKVIGGINIVK